MGNLSGTQLFRIDKASITVGQAAMFVGGVIAAVGILFGLLSWAHTNLVVPSIISECKEDSRAAASEAIVEHSKTTHRGSVSDDQFEACMILLNEVRQDQKALNNAVISIQAKLDQE